MNFPPKDIGSAVAEWRVLWPDRSHRTVAEAWQLTPAQIAEARRQHEEPHSEIGGGNDPHVRMEECGDRGVD